MADYVIAARPGTVAPELVRLIVGDVGGLEELQVDAL